MINRTGRLLRNTLGMLAMAALAACSPQEQAPPSVHQPGQWLAVNYWAEWCKPCIEEIPELNEFARKHAPAVRVMLVNFDGVSGAALQQQAAALGIDSELLADADPALELGLTRPQALPATFIIDPQGAFQEVLLGPQTIASPEAALQLGAEP
jgi:thiol-disulfide isomerase/thioredoxin